MKTIQRIKTSFKVSGGQEYYDFGHRLRLTIQPRPEQQFYTFPKIPVIIILASDQIVVTGTMGKTDSPVLPIKQNVVPLHGICTDDTTTGFSKE